MRPLQNPTHLSFLGSEAEALVRLRWRRGSEANSRMDKRLLQAFGLRNDTFALGFFRDLFT